MPGSTGPAKEWHHPISNISHGPRGLLLKLGRPYCLHFSDVEIKAEGGQVTCSGHTAQKQQSWDMKPGRVGPPYAVGLSRPRAGGSGRWTRDPHRSSHWATNDSTLLASESSSVRWRSKHPPPKLWTKESKRKICLALGLHSGKAGHLLSYEGGRELVGES